MNIKNIIKDLSYTGYTKEIIRHEAIRIIEEQNKEIERLNNIIDELEKIINDYQITSELDSDYKLIYDLKNKLKEWKEGK